jgi:hypothetical protein
MHFVRIGNRAINLDLVSHCEVQAWHDTVSVKVFMTGTANNTPVVLNEVYGVRRGEAGLARRTFRFATPVPFIPPRPCRLQFLSLFQRHDEQSLRITVFVIFWEETDHASFRACSQGGNFH